MKKCIIVIIALLYSFLGVNMLFAGTDTWTQKADVGGIVRDWAVGFSIGNKGYIGTGSNGGSYYKDFWEYDPAANTWTQKADFGGTERVNAVGFSIGNKGYIGTGFGGSGIDFWEYDPAANTWTQKANFEGTSRFCAVGFSIGSKGYIGTGFCGTFTKDFWEYDPAANNWTQKADFGGTERAGAVGFSIGSKGYIGTGWNSSYSSRYKDFWEYDPAANTWTQKADFGGTARGYAVGFSIGNKGYIGTGDARPDSPAKNDFWEYDPAANTWTQKADFGGTGRNAAVGFSIGSKGFIGTGVDVYTFTKDFWEYDPSTTADTVPIVDAGPNITIESGKQVSTIIHGSASDPNGDAMTYRWLEGVNVLQGWGNVGTNGEAPLNLGTLPNFSKGMHSLVLEVSDGKATSADEMILTIDNSAPHAAPSGGGIYQVNTSVVIGGQVSDFDGDHLSYQWLEGETVLFSGLIQAINGGTPVYLPYVTINNLDVGIHTLTLRVSDGINKPVSASIAVKIIDTVAPTLAPAPDKAILWPANHKMVTVTIFANASDNSGKPVSLKASVASNEPEEGLGDGDTYPDWTEPVISNGIITLKLRAERSGRGNGRTYTIMIEAMDDSGNTSTAKVNISVPHDKGK
jgi:N-acetylneuraminic acid mutarotase